MNQITINFAEGKVTIVNSNQTGVQSEAGIQARCEAIMVAANVTDRPAVDVQEVAFDFEKDIAYIRFTTFDWTIVQGMGLKEKESNILAAMGYERVDMSDVFQLMNGLLSGQISKDEFQKRAEQIAAQEAAKAQQADI